MAEAEAKERKILVAVDEGEESMYALSWCLKNMLCKNYKDTLVLLYAKQPRPVYLTLDGTGRRGNYTQGYLFSTDIMVAMENYTNNVANSVMERAKRMCKEVCDDLKVVTRVECGDARDMICQMAEKLNVDLVVMGSRGYGLIKRTFLGSVSNHCAQNVNCSVLIVKRPKPAAAN